VGAQAGREDRDANSPAQCNAGAGVGHAGGREREAFRSQPRELGDGQGRLFTGDNDKGGVSAFFVDHLLSCILKFIFLGGLSTNTREKWALPVGPHT
jgi:hypothetical protein